MKETPNSDIIFTDSPTSAIRFFTFLPHESLNGAIQFAAYAAIRSRTTNRMPYPDICNHPRPFALPFLPDSITYTASAYRAYGILALCSSAFVWSRVCVFLYSLGPRRPCRGNCLEWKNGTHCHKYELQS